MSTDCSETCPNKQNLDKVVKINCELKVHSKQAAEVAEYFRLQLNEIVAKRRTKNFKRQQRRKGCKDGKRKREEENSSLIPLVPLIDLTSILEKTLLTLNSIHDILQLEHIPEAKSLMQNKKFECLFNLIPSLTKLSSMVGLQDLKTELFQMILHQLHVKHSKRAEEPGMNNIIITGPPGVGKTELATILAEVFVQTGQLKTNQVVFAKRSDLVGQYLGQTAIKTSEVLEKAKGGILFIDEVYSLGHVEKRDFFAKECIDTLLQHMSEKPGECMVIVAGYEDDVETCFLAQNKGLNRRFTIRLNIAGYDGAELFRIFQLHCTKDNWKLEEPHKAQEFILKHAKDFQNYAGDMKTLLHRAKFISTQRLWKTSLDFLSECSLNFEDIRQAKEYMHKKSEHSVDKLDRYC